MDDQDCVSNYSYCLQQCTGNCWHSITPSTYAFNQQRLLQARSKRSNFDNDKLIKDRIFENLRRHNIKSTRDRIHLKFFETLEFKDRKTENIEICENCFVNYNSNNSMSTYYNWKRTIKYHIVFDILQAEMTQATSTKIKERNITTKATFKNIFEARKELADLG